MVRPRIGRGPAGSPSSTSVFADIYGERRLLARGLIPAELVLGHPGFLRACVGMSGAGDPRLFLTAVDVARDEAGRVSEPSADRTQAPSGLGYALVNRTILSRVLPAASPRRSEPNAWPASSGQSGAGWPGPHRTGPTSPGWSS